MVESSQAKFYRMLGRRIGQPYRPRVSGHVDVLSNPGARIRRISRGVPGIPSRITNRYNRRVGGVGVGGGNRSSGYTGAAVTGIWQNVYDKLVDQYQETANQQEAINRANEEESQRDYPWYQDVMNAVTGLGGDDSGFSSSIIGRGLDVLSRPAYGLFEGMQSIAEKPPEERNNSLSDAVSDVVDFGAGFWRGLSGEDKTGFGQVYESLKDNMEADFLRNFEEAHPDLESWVSRGVGLVGEVGLDPLNVVMPAAPRIMRHGAHAGEEATEAILRESLDNLVTGATDEFVNNSGLIGNNPMYANNPDLLTARLQASLAETVDNSIVNVTGGGNRAVRLMNDRYWPTTVANQGVTEIQEAMTAPFVQRVDELMNNGFKGAVNPDFIVNLYRGKYADFDDFWARLEATFPPGSTVDDIVDAIRTGRVSRSRINALVRDTVGSKYGSALERTYKDIFEGARNPTYRTVGIRVGNRTVPIRPIGRAYDFARTAIDNSPLSRVMPSRGAAIAQSFEGTFPGTFALKIGRARALSIKGMDNFTEEMEKLARQFTPEESKELFHALENGTKLVGTSVRGGDKAAVLQQLRDMLDDIFLDEQKFGARSRKNVRGDNYVYIFNKGGTQRERAAFKINRKEAWNDPARRGPGEFNFQYAKDHGLRPVDDVFQMMRYRKIKSTRDLTRAHFMQDLLENYAIHGGDPVLRLPKKAIRDRDLVDVVEVARRDLLSDSLRAAAKAKGGRFYLPRPIWEMYQKFEELSSWTSADWNVMGRAFANIVGKLKKWLTIPYPGFHMKNMIGDVFMGLLDDINPNDYTRVIAQRTAKLAGKAGHFRILPGLEFTYDEMRAEFQKVADAGFIHMDMDTYSSMTAGNVVRQTGHKIADIATKLSDKREQFPRFVHFVTAYEDEAKALWKSGVRDLDIIKQRAADAATWRVNNFKFDYAALMPFEKKIKTAAFPFYTYLRKALPVLLQQMYLNPHYFSTANRFMEYNDGSAADNFNSTRIPQWIRDIGFGMLTDEEEPWAVTADLLPFGALDILGSRSAGEFSQNVLSNLNPLLQAPIELFSKKELFSGRPIDRDLSTFEYLLQNIPMLQDIQEELGVPVPGLPGRVGDPVWEQLTSTDALHNRLAGLGLPIRHISDQQQQQQQNANYDDLIENPIQEFNYSQDRYRITVTDDFQYRVTDQITGVVQGVVPTPQAAIEFAKSLGGADYNQPYTSPYRPPSSMDVEAILQQMGVTS